MGFDVSSKCVVTHASLIVSRITDLTFGNFTELHGRFLRILDSFTTMTCSDSVRRFCSLHNNLQYRKKREYLILLKENIRWGHIVGK